MSACSATKHSSSITLQKVYVGVSFRKETGTITETLTNLPRSFATSNAKLLCHCHKIKKCSLSFQTHLKLTRQIPHQKNAPTLCGLTNLCVRYITPKPTVSPPSDSRHLLVLFLPFSSVQLPCVRLPDGAQRPVCQPHVAPCGQGAVDVLALLQRLRLRLHGGGRHEEPH